MWFFLSLLVILVSFEFINVIIIGTFWFLLGMWCFCVSMFLCFLCFSCQKPVKKNCGIPVLLNVLQAANNFSKVSLNFNKILNYVRQVLQTYSAYAFFVCYKKKVLQKQLTKIDLKVPRTSCDEIDDNVTKFILQ